MSNAMGIHVHHVTRVEGHGNIVVNAANGKVERVEWQVPEAPRFFEAMVRGHSYQDIQTIVSRICGICSITHSLAATKAVENALGIEVSEQADAVRILMHFSEQLQSHVLHVGYLAAPDFFGVPSVVPLAAKAGEAVKTVIRLHRLANEWSDLIAGRTTHPVTLTPGGLTRIPTEQQFRDLQQRLKGCVKDLNAVVDVVLSVAGAIPQFERPTEYVSLRQDNPPTYTFYHGADRLHRLRRHGSGQRLEDRGQRVRLRSIHVQVVQVAPRFLRGGGPGPVQQQRGSPFAAGQGGGQAVWPQEGLLPIRS